jgi:AraC-like DNA-binding protein
MRAWTCTIRRLHSAFCRPAAIFAQRKTPGYAVSAKPLPASFLYLARSRLIARHQVLTFTDPHDYQDRLGGADERIVILAPGQYRAALTHLDFGSLLLQRGHQSLPLVSAAGGRADVHSIVMLLEANQPDVRFNGLDAGYRSLVVLGAGNEYHYRAAADLRWGSVTMPAEQFMASARALLGRDMAPASATRLLAPSATAMRRMRSLHERAAGLAAAAPDGLHANVATALRHALAQAMITCLAADREHEASVPLDGRSAVVVRRFMEMVEQDPGRPLYMLDVCKEVGVAGRTLRQYCLGHLGMSPSRYLWLRRMNLARRALAQPSGGAVSVTEIANEFGFGELGRFAVRYRQLFGESPSATLRRSGSGKLAAD